jgi:molybdopterin synthase catalytic subunit
MEKFLTEGAITDKIITELISDDNNDFETGAMSIFIGKVRADLHDNKRVTSIEYSAYPEMVASVGGDIINTIKNTFPDVRNIKLVHSAGMVMAGQTSLVVVVTSGHRDEAIRACSQIVEMIKESFPVWKKEIFSDSSSEWKEV